MPSGETIVQYHTCARSRMKTVLVIQLYTRGRQEDLMGKALAVQTLDLNSIPQTHIKVKRERTTELSSDFTCVPALKLYTE